MKKQKAIGVFDSGVGGLTVLESLMELFPHEDFIYVADTLNCPYGTRTKEDIANKVTDVVTYLLERDVKAIVIACNTATANSQHLSQLTKIPMIGVIEPTAKFAKKVTKNHNIAVLATIATIDSKKYEDYLITEQVFPVKCSEFVGLVENNQYQTNLSYKIVKNKLDYLKLDEIDTVILGCTHFGILSEEIQSVFSKATLVSSGAATAKELFCVLDSQNLLNDGIRNQYIEINTTGEIEELKKQIIWFRKPYNELKKIILNKRD